MARAAAKTSFSETRFVQGEQPDFVLVDAEFEDCSFAKLALSGQKLGRSRFFDCVFSDCDLSLCRLVDCAFVRSTFERCRLSGINWSEVEKLERVAFDGSQLNDTTFIGVKMELCDFSRAIAHRASFRDLSLKSCIFRDADLSESEFVNADLRQADFRGASGYVINPKENRLEKARFSLPEAVRLLNGLGVLLD
ncbi:MAG TPA: pentapeptide repeat-containing protein [Polyangiaceae bacterium]|nr:pentapeptide repeat-containing protein [Polyangiaceae bacterium]